MSQKSHHQQHHYNEKTTPVKFPTKTEHVQRRNLRCNQCQENCDESHADFQNPNLNGAAYSNPIETPESYDIIRYDEPPEPHSSTAPNAEYLSELYRQDNNSAGTLNQTVSYYPERRAGKSLTCQSQRSRSLPTSSEMNNRLAANFPYDDEYVQNENTGKRSPSRQSEEEGPPSRCRSVFRKVSYGQRSRGSEKLVSCKKPTSPVQCRFRSDCVETDESDMIMTEVSNVRKSSRPPSPMDNRSYSSPQPPCPMRTSSDRSLIFDAQSVEDFETRTNNNNNNYRVVNRYSQDCIPSFYGPPPPGTNIYGQDMLPLPIEIPDNVADAEAFRRYLSVRRGAITPVRQQNISFSKRNQSCPSYESIGRRSRKPSIGLAASGAQQLGEQEARRRTSSLSHAIMTLALLSASICQLRFLITYSHAHSYPILNYFLVYTSIILEVAAGVGYVLIARCGYDDAHAESIHNYLIFALFIVAISNVILTAFAFDDHLCDEMKWKNSQVAAPSSSSQNQQFNQQVQQQNQRGGGGGDRVMDLRYMPLE